MDQSNTNSAEDLSAGAPETPEDVAVLYTWANVHGAKYRDFSAARREFRAQQRHRQVEAQRQVELEAARAAEDAAHREVEEARRLEEAANSESERQSAERARIEAEERAGRDRLTAQRHTNQAEELRQAMEEARREMEDARQRAEEQAARYAEADARLRAEQGNRPKMVPGEIDDPYYFAGHLDPSEFAPAKGIRGSQPSRVSSEKRITTTYLRSLQETVQNQRNSSGPRLARSASGYHIVAAKSVVPVDTPEDVRERNRADERERLSGYIEQAADLDNSGYYDGEEDDREPVKERETSRPRSGLNSARGDIYIAPRQTAEIRAYQPEDSDIDEPTPGNARVIPESVARRRRRALSADVVARTERQPRYSDSVGDSSGYTAASEPAPPARATPEIRDVRYRERVERAAPEPHRDPAPEPVANANADPLADSAERPEWLGGDSDPDRPKIATGAPQPVAVVDGRAKSVTAREERIAARKARAVDDVTRMMPAAVDPLSDPVPSRTTPGRDSRGERQAAEARRARRREDGAMREAPRAGWTSSDDSGPREKAPERRVVSADRPRAEEDVDAPRRSPREAQREVPREPSRSAPPHVSRASANASNDTLQQSREKVAARWFALKGLMGSNAEHHPEPAPTRQREIKTPMLTIVSLSGGVGKTSLVATLGRVLSAEGEKILLSDTTAHGLLPYYFGARELRPSVVRTFSPPPGSSDAPVYMVSYEAERMMGDDAAQIALMEEIERNARGTQRVLIDLNAGSAWLAKRLAHLGSNMLVPIVPDMNSVLSIQAIERLFSGVTNAEGRPVEPSFVLNQFDASLPLHLDVREVLRQQLGDRLLPVIVRRSPAVAEALAEGMTVMDYAPESPVTEDYMNLAAWVRKMAAPASTGFRSIRWSER